MSDEKQQLQEEVEKLANENNQFRENIFFFCFFLKNDVSCKYLFWIFFFIFFISSEIFSKCGIQFFLLI
ncbi:hypothetical protein FGO68_gene1480 [Halteria grandinella]|uniref:Uncharacterized protein n=1 Tax=Halteria grandinella TaxID=5974 RepID=A0A8J8SVY8_HALGN|nr:hypothetical protein FGO68_gene1480 [Halteria grandinella]